MRIAASFVGAVVSAIALPALAEPAFPVLTDNYFQDCGSPRAQPEVCRVRRDLTVEEAERRLGADKVALWADGVDFTVVARGTGDDLQMGGALNAPLARLPGTDLWTITARTQGLDAALLDAIIMTGGPLKPTQWRGPNAEPKPAMAAPFTGKLTTVEVASPHLPAPRRVTVYQPAGFDPARTYPVVYVADGSSAGYFAQMVDQLIQSGRLRPLILVGVHNSDRRMQEYLIDYPDARPEFEAHERFFLEQVMTRAEREWGASPKREERMLMGHSNGAGWAVDTARRHPEMFANVYAVSVGGGGPGGRQWTPSPQQPIRFFLAAGQLETPFLRGTRQVAEQAPKAGHQVTLKTPVAGHSNMVVEAYLDDALIGAFGASGARPQVAAR